MACTSNSDCADTEVCVYEECLDAQSAAYFVTVESWTLPDCGSLSEYDLYWTLELDGQLIFSSSSVGCPGVWNESTCVPAPSGGRVEFRLYDYDPIGDAELVDQFCWPNPAVATKPCEQIPSDVLHAGAFDDWTVEGAVRITFKPEYFCP